MAEIDFTKRLELALATDRPEAIDSISVRTGADSTGGPAVWILLVLKDDAPSRQVIEQAEEWAVERATEVSREFWPYVAFRTRREQTEVEREAKSPR